MSQFTFALPGANSWAKRSLRAKIDVTKLTDEDVIKYNQKRESYCTTVNKYVEKKRERKIETCQQSRPPSRQKRHEVDPSQASCDNRIRKRQKVKESVQDLSKVVKETKPDNKVATKPASPLQPVRDTMSEEGVVPQLKEWSVVADNQEEAEALQDEDSDYPMYDLFGSYVEEENEPEEQYENTPASLNDSPPLLSQTNKQLEVVSKIPQSNLEHISKELKSKELPAEEEDPFKTPLRSPTSVEGPTRNTLKRVRPQDEHDSSYIPKRKKNEIAEGVNTLPLPVVQQPTRPPNAVASSSKINPQNMKPIVAAPEPLPTAPPPPREPSPQTAAISDGDVFASKPITNNVKGKAKAVDIPYAIETKAPPRIGIHRQSLHGGLNPSISVASWRGSIFSARTRTLLTSDSSHCNHNRKSRSLQQSISELDFSDDDKLFAFRAAQETAKKVAEMACDHGVSTEIAMKTYTKTGSMEKTKVILEHFRQTLLAAEQEIYERMPTVADNLDDYADKDQECTQREETDLYLPLFPSIARKPIERISGGRENDPTSLPAAREHRILASNVHEENADDMRTFEAKHNPDLLRLWSINMVKEMITLNGHHLRVKEEIKDGDGHIKTE